MLETIRNAENDIYPVFRDLKWTGYMSSFALRLSHLLDKVTDIVARDNIKIRIGDFFNLSALL